MFESLPVSSPQWFEFALGVLATWRVSHLIAREEGPWDLVLKLRAKAGSGVVGRLMDCPYCVSLWVAAPVGAWFGDTWGRRGLWWLALSAGACLVERWWDTRERVARTQDVLVEEERTDV